MLVLSRKANESIVIDGRITVTVVRLRGNRIQLGIEAPKEVPVFRKELMNDEAEEAEQPAGACAA